MRLKEIIKALNAEIAWHRAHPSGSGCSESYENGFIVGLKQAKALVRALERTRKKAR